MSEGKVLFDGGVKTQSVESVKSMVEFLTGEPCRDLPAVVRLANGWRLTKSGKGDCYYMTSKESCSCPGFYYHQTCKHIKALRDQEEAKGMLLLDAHAFDTTEGEVEYWQKKEQKSLTLKKEPELSESQAFARRIVEAMES